MTNYELRDKFWDLRQEAEKLKGEVKTGSYFWWKLDEIENSCTVAMNKLDEVEVGE